MKRAILIAALMLSSWASSLAADFEIRQEGVFRELIDKDARLVKLGDGMKFTEGPVWLDRDGGMLVFSDIPADTLFQWTEKGGIKPFRQPSRKANGNTTDRKERILVTCEHGSRTVTLTDSEGKVSVQAETYKNARLNSPNDAVIKRDGTIWFTDPDYGIERPQREQDANYVFRLDPKTREIAPVVSDFDKPNGLCFSPDEKRLYVADSGQPKYIRVFDVDWDNTLSNGRVFCKIDKGGPDGIRTDRDGRVWSSAGDGVHIFDKTGQLIGKILVPEAPANLCFGGKSGRTLFITARTSLYSIETKVKGAR